MANRKRKVDLSRLSTEELKNLEVELGGKVRKLFDGACEKANKLLNIYGLSAKMKIIVGPSEIEKKEPKHAPESALVQDLTHNL